MGFRYSVCAAALVAAFFSHAWAADDHDARSAAERRAAAAADVQARRSSNEVLRALKALERAPAAQRAQRESELAKAVEERRAAMLELVRTDPRGALSMAMPEALRERMPKAVRERIEQRVQLEGRIVGMSIDDHERGIVRHPFFLESDDPTAPVRVGLQWADPSLSERDTLALIDKRVRVKGLRVNGQLVVGDRNEVELAASKGHNGKGNTKDKTGSSTDSGSAMGSTGSETGSVTAPLVSGDQRTLVIMANFSDKASGCTTSGLKTALFGTGASVDRIFRESSANQVTFSGDVVGPFTIPYTSSSTCDFNAWGTAADAATRSAGIDPSRYTRISYAIPRNSTCGWTGIAYIGGSAPTRSWVASCSAGVFAHEIGHNLRFKHASTPTSEYGDNSDPMGTAPSVQMHAANRVMAGWVTDASIVDNPGSGSYAIAALEAPDTGMPRTIRIRKADTNEYYYVSLRAASGLSASLSGGYRDVVTVHRATGTMPSPTVLLALLAPGQSFSDATNGVRVTAQSISTGTASVNVETTVAQCARSTPGVQASPASQTGAPGSTLRYSVSITNRNSPSCGNSSFSFAQTTPGGFSGSFSSASVTLAPGASVTLAPGASATVGWSVASSAQTGDGVYALQARAAEPGGSAGSAAASYVVYADASAPTVSVTWPTDGATIASKPVSLSASAFDDNGIARVDFLVNGKSVGSASTAPYQVRWNPNRSKGANTLTVRATDRAGNASEASVRFTVR
ncbi:MAG: Ig-like domain-containing protein [Burkholderiaceae bacterium]|nr:Ig-like domain-containing protein [Burkholderiaceae bacterium]